MTDESTRAARLLDAQAKAASLFAEIGTRRLIAAGQGERAVSDRIRDLANEMFGTTHYWHKRIVRSGPNTLLPYRENPPDRVIGADDIVFADFGPIFEEFEADFGRTFVLGDDPVKHRLRDDLSTVFAAGRRAFEADPDITGKQLYTEVERLAAEAGWQLGGWRMRPSGGRVPARVQQLGGRRLPHRARQRETAAAHGRGGTAPPLDPGDPSHRP